MVKFLLLAFALSVSCAHHKIPEISPSEVCAFGDERVWCVYIYPELGLSMFTIYSKYTYIPYPDLIFNSILVSFNSCFQ